jgi:hypothetical protein
MEASLGCRTGGGLPCDLWSGCPSPSHLGDLAFYNERSVSGARLAAYDRAIRHGKAWGADVVGWFMSATLLHQSGRASFFSPQVTYRGYPDSGYRITTGSKHSRKGGSKGRRSLKMYSLEDEIGIGVVLQDVVGQVVRPTDRIWCPVCGTLNQLDWPSVLRDREAP